MFIIHAPSSVTGFYKDTPQRKLAREAPFAKTPVPLSTDERWGTAWCWPDKKREAGPAHRRLGHGLRLRGQVQDP